MLYISDLNGNTEPLNHIQRVEKDEEVNGGSTLSLTSFFHENNPGHDLIEEEAIIHTDGHDYRIKQLKENKGRKEAVAIHTFFDVAGTWKHEIFGGTRSFDDFANFTFSGTGWTVEIEGVSGVAFIANFGNHNIIQLVQTLCSVYECEYQILPGKRILFAKQIGPDNDAQYRYRHNIKALSKSVDSTNLYTLIKGYGIDGVEVVHTSPNAAKYGIYEAEPIYDEEYSAEMMSERLARELTDYPEVVFDMDVVELLDKVLGERIWLIYEPMNIEFQTRVLAKKSIWRNGKFITESITIGNVKRKTLSDILASTKIEIDENARQTRSRIEQTNTNITLAVEEFAGEILKAYGKIEVTASEIRQEVGELGVRLEQGIADNTSLISQTATQIRQEVSETVTSLEKDIDGQGVLISQNTSLINQTAREIKLEVTEIVNGTKEEIMDNVGLELDELAGGIAGNTKLIKEAQSSITQTAGQIRQEISETISRVDSDIESSNALIASNTSLINQTAREIKLEVAETLKLAKDDISTDVKGELAEDIARLEGGISSNFTLIKEAQSSITQTARDIRLEVSESTTLSKDYTDEQKQLIIDKINEDVAGLDGKVTAVDGKIGTVIDELGTLDTELESLNGEIVEIKRESSSQFNVLSNAITAAVTDSKSYADSVGGTVSSNANSKIEVLAGSISSKAESSTVSALGTRINSVEFTMDAVNTEITQKVSKTEYNGNTLVSMINQTPSHIKISAPNIELTGAVKVLSDISGKLGNITAGNIDISEDMKIGAGLYLRGNGQFTGIYFGSTQIMQDGSDYLNLGQKIRMGAFTEINGQLDLTRANVSWGNNRPAAVWG